MPEARTGLVPTLGVGPMGHDIQSIRDADMPNGVCFPPQVERNWWKSGLSNGFATYGRAKFGGLDLLLGGLERTVPGNDAEGA